MRETDMGKIAESGVRTFMSQLDQHFGKCAVLAAAGVGGGMMAAPQTAEANIVYSGPVNINIPSTTSGIYLNVVTGVFATTPSGASGWDLNPWSSSGFQIWANNAASPNDG